jgi:hypothetical protein
VLSWIVWFAPALEVDGHHERRRAGKNYIDQSREFAACMVALAPFVMSLFSQKRFVLSAACALLMLAFFAN